MYFGCHEWYEQFKICCLVTGGNGSSVNPLSTGAEVSRSVIDSAELMVAGIDIL